MICPLCNREVEDPPNMEEVFATVECHCGDYKIEYWDKQIQKEVVEVWSENYDTEYKVVFDRAKNETQVLKICHSTHERQWDTWTEHLITVPAINTIPDAKTLLTKIKMWLVFS